MTKIAIDLKGTTKTATRPDGSEVTFKVWWERHDPRRFCDGEWHVERNDIDLSHFIPDRHRRSPMGTTGTYVAWVFSEEGDVTWETYADGEEWLRWAAINYKWLRRICHGSAETKALFEAFQAEDWRRESCGGCI